MSNSVLTSSIGNLSRNIVFVTLPAYFWIWSVEDYKKKKYDSVNILCSFQLFLYKYILLVCSNWKSCTFFFVNDQKKGFSIIAFFHILANIFHAIEKIINVLVINFWIFRVIINWLFKKIKILFRIFFLFIHYKQIHKQQLSEHFFSLNNKPLDNEYETNNKPLDHDYETNNKPLNKYKTNMVFIS